MYNINLCFEWNSVLEGEAAEVYRYPQPFDKKMNRIYSTPAIYRWRIYDLNTDAQVVYIGETDNLKRRVAGYLRPGPSQHTNIRMKALFEQYILKGFLVELDLIQIKHFTFNDILFHQDSLSSKNIRVLLENLIILDHKNNGFEILNAKI